MQIDDKLIAYLENLSNLALSDSDKQRLTGDLQGILDGMARMGELNTQNVTERSHPFDNVNAFRDDMVQASFDRELILQNAPVRTDDMFIAPRTI